MPTSSVAATARGLSCSLERFQDDGCTPRAVSRPLPAGNFHRRPWNLPLHRENQSVCWLTRLPKCHDPPSKMFSQLLARFHHCVLIVKRIAHPIGRVLCLIPNSPSSDHAPCFVMGGHFLVKRDTAPDPVDCNADALKSISPVRLAVYQHSRLTKEAYRPCPEAPRLRGGGGKGEVWSARCSRT